MIGMEEMGSMMASSPMMGGNNGDGPEDSHANAWRIDESDGLHHAEVCRPGWNGAIKVMGQSLDYEGFGPPSNDPRGNAYERHIHHTNGEMASVNRKAIQFREPR